jgi:hypothetical protein
MQNRQLAKHYHSVMSSGYLDSVLERMFHAPDGTTRILHTTSGASTVWLFRCKPNWLYFSSCRDLMCSILNVLFSMECAVMSRIPSNDVAALDVHPQLQRFS